MLNRGTKDTALCNLIGRAEGIWTLSASTTGKNFGDYRGLACFQPSWWDQKYSSGGTGIFFF